MKKTLGLVAALLATSTLAGCYSPGERALGGAALGGAGGAIIGSAVSGGRASGALAGAAIGAGTGAVVGAATAPQPAYGYGYRRGGGCARWGYDYYGNTVCTAYY
ncbi:MAG: hypothetical protein KGL46_09515 [Hyphomicrobiales bacterium]|nr:hypothetical protein [Hyphomicrobiales bacterium]